MEQNLSLYKIFHTVAGCGSISLAARTLYISQPAISKAIQKLENSLETTLFIRNSRGVQLTKEGLLLYQHTKTVFHTLEQAEKELRQEKELNTGHIRIGASTTLCKYLLLPYLKDFIRENPHIKITIECQSTVHSLTLLEQKKLDIGLIAKPASSTHLNFLSLGEIQDIFVASKSYIENLKLRNPDWKSNILTTANLMLLDKENMTRQYIDDYFRENHIETNQLLEVTTMDLLIEFARIGLGAACVIKEFVKKDLDNDMLIEIPLGIPIHKREIGFCYPNSPSSAADSFLRFILQSEKGKVLF
jgi:DNA-binding transcriptional LysR family regulator